ALKLWGAAAWNSEALDRRAATEGWTKAMRDQANRAAIAFDGEARKMAAGVDALRKDQRLLEAFVAMNRAMSHAAAGRYESWRAFQIGFILASLPALRTEGHLSAQEPVDVLWFPTGGGKTETYLGLLIIAAIFDRLRGKVAGTTAWSRFPLR